MRGEREGDGLVNMSRGPDRRGVEKKKWLCTQSAMQPFFGFGAEQFVLEGDHYGSGTGAEQLGLLHGRRDEAKALLQDVQRVEAG